MHDYDVITRIASLINSLHGQYEVSNRMGSAGGGVETSSLSRSFV